MRRREKGEGSKEMEAGDKREGGSYLLLQNE